MQANLDAIKKSAETGHALEEMSEAYAELSVIRLDRIRVKIERNRVFALQLAQTFHEVRATVAQFKMPERKKKDSLTLIICSNLGFFLDMETRLVQSFMNSRPYGDLIMIGRSGSEILRNCGYMSQFENVIFSHDLPTPAELNKVAEKVAEYDRVVVYYPQFHTVGVQEPAIVDVSGGQATKLTAATIGPKRPYILEPEAPKMLAFFESQISRLLLEQSILESELSRVAARLMMMDSARQRAEKYVKTQDALLAFNKKRRLDIKIQELSLGFLASQHQQTSLNF